MLNIVSLREHNRLAGIARRREPGWDDERLFQTARNIMIVLLLKLVVEEYIEHIGPLDSRSRLVPFIADDERWNRPNWCAVEFNILYRWHSLVPDTVGDGAGQLRLDRVAQQQPARPVEQGMESLHGVVLHARSAGRSAC